MWEGVDDDGLMGKAEAGGRNMYAHGAQCDCLYYKVDKDMFGNEGWRWGRGGGSAAWHYDYYYDTGSSRVNIQRQSPYWTGSSEVNRDVSVM